MDPDNDRQGSWVVRKNPMAAWVGPAGTPQGTNDVCKQKKKLIKIKVRRRLWKAVQPRNCSGRLTHGLGGDTRLHIAAHRLDARGLEQRVYTNCAGDGPAKCSQQPSQLAIETSGICSKGQCADAHQVWPGTSLRLAARKGRAVVRCDVWWFPSDRH